MPAECSAREKNKNAFMAIRDRKFAWTIGMINMAVPIPAFIPEVK